MTALIIPYGLSLLSLKLIFSYFSNRTHRPKIKECFGNRLKIEYGVPQGLISGPLLFNINPIDMFYECEDSDIESYADDTTPYACASDINTVISELQITASKFFTCFDKNHMKANPEKSHFSLSFKTPKKAYFGGALVESSSTEKLLEIQIDSDLTFDENISSICNKVAKKIDVLLSRLVDYMSLDKRRLLMKDFIESLIWMFHSRTLNNKINRLHERALRIAYSDYKSSFCELLEKDKSFLIHHKNIQGLAIKIYKFLHNLSPCIMNNINKANQPVPYDLRKRNFFKVEIPVLQA